MYTHFSKALIRTPLNSLNQMDDLDAGLNDSLFNEGLYLASPELLQEWKRFDDKTPQKKEKLLLSLKKYWIRSCMRCTPFGTFAGCSLTDIQPGATHLELGDKSGYRKKIRLDMNFLSTLVENVLQDSVIQENMQVHTNNSLYELADEYRYVEYAIRDNSRVYNLTSVQKTDYLSVILESAKTGATINELIRLILADDIEEADAREFVLELLSSQILISELEPGVTGEDALDVLITRLSRINKAYPVLQLLHRIRQVISEAVNYIDDIETLLGLISPGTESLKNTTQLDLFLSLNHRSLDTSLIEEIVRQTNDLLCLSRRNENNDLETFKAAFTRMFEEQEIPLAVALDLDIGVGYARAAGSSVAGNDMIEDLHVTQNRTVTTEYVDYIKQFVLRKYIEYIEYNKDGIVIEESELKAFQANVTDFVFPHSMALMGTLVKDHPGPLDKDNFLFDIYTFSGPAAANLLGRFAYADKEIESLIRDVLVEEECNLPDVIFAEVAHLPQARVGNVLLRPNLRRYEIPYVGKSGIAEEYQIPIEDLTVSIRDNKVILRSKRLDREVIPRLSTAHNYNHGSLPMYKFLCDLQNQGLSSPNIWDWGMLRQRNHLPRVSYKNLVLAKAVWTIEEKEFEQLPEEETARIAFVDAWRVKRKVPQQVCLTQGDNQLFIDFSKNSSIQLFMHYLNRYKGTKIEEFLPTADNCIIRDAAGRPYASELIIPLYKPRVHQEPVAGLPNRRPAENGITRNRRFALDSNWLYFKVYSGVDSAEKILINTIYPFVEENKGLLFDKFFFIRFSDDNGPHLRLRFYSEHAGRNMQIFTAFNKALNSGVTQPGIAKITMDEYIRELERYTPLLIEDAESIFYNDSVAVLKFLAGADESGHLRSHRLFFALRGIDALMNDFHFSLEQKQDLARQMSESFLFEFGGSKQLRKQLNEKYRVVQRDIFSFMDPEKDVQNDFTAVTEILEERSAANSGIVTAILGKIGEDKTVLLSWLPSHIHLFMNRLFISQQRRYELLLYNFMERYYASKIARLKLSKV